MLAHKTNSDNPYNNGTFADTLDIPIKDLDAMECLILEFLQWNTIVSSHTFRLTGSQLFGPSEWQALTDALVENPEHDTPPDHEQLEHDTLPDDECIYQPCISYYSHSPSQSSILSGVESCKSSDTAIYLFPSD